MRLRAAINAMCKACTYDPQDRGTCAQQISCCVSNECPLHSVRPINARAIPDTLLAHWRLTARDLDARARALVVRSVEPQTEVVAVTVEVSSGQVGVCRSAHERPYLTGSEVNTYG
jgi:hypothetical protein